jgi:hypothetical protein
MYMRLRGGGAAPCSPCNTRAIPPEFPHNAGLLSKKILTFRLFYPQITFISKKALTFCAAHIIL